MIRSLGLINDYTHKQIKKEHWTWINAPSAQLPARD